MMHYRKSKKHIVIFPETDTEYNYYGTYYLPYYLKTIGADKAFILYRDKRIKKKLLKQKDISCSFFHLPLKFMKILITYHLLREQSDCMTIVSVKVPYDEYSDHLWNVKNVTKKDITYYDILGLDGADPHGK